MTTDSTDDSGYRLLLSVSRSGLHASHLSSTLRTVQAAIRSIAKGVQSASSAFGGTSQPILLLDTAASSDSGLILSFYFADPSDDSPMEELSSRVVEAFMEEFTRALATSSTSQLGLWGRIARGSGQARFESETSRRLDELRVILRRFGDASLKCGNRSITFHDGQVEIV